MREFIDKLNHIELAIFDLDGVIYRGKTLIPNVNEIIEELKEHSIRVVYNSNNSTITRQAYVDRLREFKIPSEITDFYTSASIASAEITKIKQNATIFVIGEVGLREELRSCGHNIVTDQVNFREVDFVLVGLDRDFNYDKLSFAQKCIMEGNAKFYATNADSTLPVANGFKPGAGVMVNSLTTCSGTKPIRIFGKPETIGIQSILRDTQIPAENACIFGDRLNTDILAGNRAGITTIAVLTGVVTRDKIENLKGESQNSDQFDKNLIPDITINTLNEIFKI